MLGEFPDLPPDIIKALHYQTNALWHQGADRLSNMLWDTAAVEAVQLFEGWKRHVS